MPTISHTMSFRFYRTSISAKLSESGLCYYWITSTATSNLRLVFLAGGSCLQQFVWPPQFAYGNMSSCFLAICLLLNDFIVALRARVCWACNAPEEGSGFLGTASGIIYQFPARRDLFTEVTMPIYLIKGFFTEK